MKFLSIVLFAIALSLDGMGVGIAYGMRKIKIPISSLLVISCTSACAIGISMLFGHLLSTIISPELAEVIGAVILVGVGIWIVVQTWRQNRDGREEMPELEHSSQQTNQQTSQVMQIHIKPFGLVIQILREPTKADIDRSGVISAREALFLGLALAMDALGAGFGAAMAGFKPLITPIVVGCTKFVLVSLGVYMGRNLMARWLGAKASLIPGWVLILLGIKQMFRL